MVSKEDEVLSRKTQLEVVAEELTMRNKARDIYYMKGELARQLGIDMSGFFGMYPNNYQFALLSNLGSRELALMQLVLRMTYESMCTEWFFTGTQLREFAQRFTPKINGRHAIPTGKDKDLSALGGIKELSERGFFIYERVPSLNGNKTLHRVQITAITITLEGFADMKQINDGYHFLLGEANYHGLFDEEYSEIGIIAYNKLNKAVKDHKRLRTKMPSVSDFKKLSAIEENIKKDKVPTVSDFKEPICDENEPKELHNTFIRLYKTEDKAFEKLEDSLFQEHNNPDNWTHASDTHLETKAGVIIPPQLDLSSWVDYLAHRVDIKKKMTKKAQELMIKKLIEYPKSVQSEAIATSIMNGWIGLFPEKIKAQKTPEETLV